MAGAIEGQGRGGPASDLHARVVECLKRPSTTPGSKPSALAAAVGLPQPAPVLLLRGEGADVDGASRAATALARALWARGVCCAHMGSILAASGLPAACASIEDASVMVLINGGAREVPALVAGYSLEEFLVREAERRGVPVLYVVTATPQRLEVDAGAPAAGSPTTAAATAHSPLVLSPESVGDVATAVAAVCAAPGSVRLPTSPLGAEDLAQAVRGEQERLRHLITHAEESRAFADAPAVRRARAGALRRARAAYYRLQKGGDCVAALLCSLQAGAGASSASGGPREPVFCVDPWDPLAEAALVSRVRASLARARSAGTLGPASGYVDVIGVGRVPGSASEVCVRLAVDGALPGPVRHMETAMGAKRLVTHVLDLRPIQPPDPNVNGEAGASPAAAPVAEQGHAVPSAGRPGAPRFEAAARWMPVIASEVLLAQVNTAEGQWAIDLASTARRAAFEAAEVLALLDSMTFQPDPAPFSAAPGDDSGATAAPGTADDGQATAGERGLEARLQALVAMTSPLPGPRARGQAGPGPQRRADLATTPGWTSFGRQVTGDSVASSCVVFARAPRFPARLFGAQGHDSPGPARYPSA